MGGSCEYYQELMSQMVDGDLLPAEADALREHTRTCSLCRAYCSAFSSMALLLREEASDPPDDFSRTVMRRLKTAPAQRPVTRDLDDIFREDDAHAPAAAKLRRWPRFAIAACLVIIIGSGAVFAGSRYLSLPDLDTGRQATLSQSFDAGAVRGADAPAEEAMAAAEEAPAPEAPMAAPDPLPPVEAAGVNSAAAMPEGADADTAAVDEAAVEDAAPEAAEPMAMAQQTAVEVPAAPAADTTAGGLRIVEGKPPVFTRKRPAYVPVGRDDYFEYLISDAGETPQATIHLIAVVQYSGTIYEFLCDADEEYLFWRDDPDSEPILSTASVGDFWELLM